MSQLHQQRMTIKLDQDIVVFLIGMRINKFWKIHKWWPVASAMKRMLSELYQHPEMGLLNHQSWFGRTTLMVQYWQSFEHLEAYAKNRSAEHLPAWTAFNQQIASNGDVGIWHETYLISPEQYECIYHNMPAFGLGKVGELIPATGSHQSAHTRLYKE